MAIAAAGLILVCAASASAQKLDVKIIDPQDREREAGVNRLSSILTPLIQIRFSLSWFGAMIGRTYPCPKLSESSYGR